MTVIHQKASVTRSNKHAVRIDMPMHRFQANEEVDFCIVGVGSAGDVHVQRLARAGFRVVSIEVGPFLLHETNY